MHIYALKQPVSISTPVHTRRYKAAPSDAEISPDQIYISVPGECRLIAENAPSIEKAQAQSSLFRFHDRLERLIEPPENMPMQLGRSKHGDSHAQQNTEQQSLLTEQLKALRKRHPANKQHFRIAIINGFGTALGNATMGLTALRIVVGYLQKQLPSFLIDILNGPASNPGCEDIIQHETFIGQYFRQGPSLETFCRYDAFLDFSELITLPRITELATVDWHLWWMGVSADHISPAQKRNIVHIKRKDWLDVKSTLADKAPKTIFFNPKASTELRSWPTKLAAIFVKQLLEQLPDFRVVIDRPLPVQHSRLHDLSDHIKSVEHFKALVTQVDAVITVNSYASHLADAASIPTVHICSCLPAELYPYYPYSANLNLPGYETLPGYKTFKEDSDNWPAMQPIYEAAWADLKAETVVSALLKKIQLRQQQQRDHNGLELVDHRPLPHYLTTGDDQLQRFRFQRTSSLWRKSQRQLAQWSESILSPGASAVLISAGDPELPIQLAQRVTPSGQLHIIEPRRLYAQVAISNLQSAQQSNIHLHQLVPIPGHRQGSFFDFDPWSESSPSHWGNMPQKCEARAESIDGLHLGSCDLMIIQPPIPAEFVLQGAQQIMNQQRPILVLSLISQKAARSIENLLAEHGYERMTMTFEAQSRETLMMIGIPEERAEQFEFSALLPHKDVL